MILVKYYLKRKKYLTFHSINENVSFKFLIPLDFNLDGKFDITDFWSFLKKPGLLNLFF